MREAPALPVHSGIPIRLITRMFDRLVERRERPEAIRCDNGPEFTSRHFLAWCDTPSTIAFRPQTVPLSQPKAGPAASAIQ
ncbi:MAG: hypothetical protein ACRD1L_03990 [Terriglobales bacterium]